MVRKAKKTQFVKEFHEIYKETFKICEAVALGLDRYYMRDKHPTLLSDEQREKARAIIKHLPPGWMQMPHRWDMHQ